MWDVLFSRQKSIARIFHELRCTRGAQLLGMPVALCSTGLILIFNDPRRGEINERKQVYTVRILGRRFDFFDSIVAEGRFDGRGKTSLGQNSIAARLRD